ncbi:MAG: methyltransferase domain-containing protein [Actinomycetota bacterium]|nr:methyltransferase domain-containing protein [Actinomycetota bacterium]
MLCSHVLEHVPDDRRAMREMARVLRGDGLYIVQSPVNYEQTGGTYEDVAVTDAKERMRRFSQRDHVRVYGPDLCERLEEAGFDVTVEPYFERFDEETIDRLVLAPWLGPIRNDLYCCAIR